MSQSHDPHPIGVVYKSEPVRGQIWRRVFEAQAPDMALRIWPDVGDTSDVRYLVAWLPPDDLVSSFPKLEVLFSAGAGIDQLDLDNVPSQVRIVRMVDPDLTNSMVEYATFGVLALHRDLPAYLASQRDGRWTPQQVRRAADRTVGIMGLGVLGSALAETLRGFGFRLRGWSASRKSIAGMSTFAGKGEYGEFLAGTDILICLLPLTAGTRGILCASTFAALPRGARLLNVGRGGHLVEADLLSALETGQIDCAVLDVLGQEPPVPDHKLLRHPRVIVTPHIASITHPEPAARRVLEQIRRHRAGLELSDVIDRKRGY
ncbi:glyoxylate/hydroxypyruvate reductase A [Rhizobiales bacterium GAS113]|jgi:glyoxylate/hydroxypyruvate reductase A|nr:glyoxylate/hydroxypyruvate reductase A [Rhizobiales bacterium GAS113]